MMRHLVSMIELLGIPPAEYELLQAQGNTFKTALSLIEDVDTRTRTNIREKNDARKALESHVRSVVSEFMAHSTRLTNKQREMLGIPIYKKTRTPAPVAETYPDFDLDTNMLRRIKIHFYDKGKKKTKAKPEGQHGAEIRYAILEAEPKDVMQLNHSLFDTHTPFTLEFIDADRGRKVYLALRWENTRGEKGPWSPFANAVIP
jgi:hypothetical protein